MRNYSNYSSIQWRPQSKHPLMIVFHCRFREVLRHQSISTSAIVKRSHLSRISIPVMCVALSILLPCLNLRVEAIGQSQINAGEIQGYVKDQNGDFIIGAKISLTGGQSLTLTVGSAERGYFHFGELVPGSYRIKISAEGFSEYEETITVRSGSPPTQITVVLYPTVKEVFNVHNNIGGVALDPQRAAGAKTLTEQELKELPSDPDQLNERLQQLATSSGSAPGQATITVDGFISNGGLPPKSAIREVRINPDLFSAEYDQAPYRGGRIEISTKPGIGSFHGSVFFNFNNSALNARNAFAPERVPATTRRYGLQLGGPFVRKKGGFSSISNVARLMN